MENIPSSNFTGELQNATDNLDTFLPITELVISIIVVLVGVPGNCLILRVYWIKIRRTSTHILIMALAWADLSVCVLRLFTIVVILLLLAKVEVQQVYDKSRPFQLTAISVSVAITTVIAADRYDCVCRHPHRRFFTPWRAKMAAFVFAGLAMLINVPEFLEKLSATQFAASCQHISNDVISMLSFGAALMVIAICYGKVFATIRRHVRVGIGQQDDSRRDIAMLTRPTAAVSQGPSELQIPADDGVVPAISALNLTSPKLAAKGKAVNRNSTGQGPSHGRDLLTKGTALERCRFGATGNKSLNQRVEGHAPQRVGAASLQRKTTRMLFITSVVFLLMWLPFWIFTVLEMASNCGSYITSATLNLSHDLSSIFYTNHAVNPLIYGFANVRFRKECKKVLSKSRCC